MPIRSPKMYGFIFGFQRFVWCPKWTPASSRSFNAIPFKVPPSLLLTEPTERDLPFTELEALARALLPVLLAFLDARIARQEAFLLQLRPQLAVVLDERSRDPEPERARLTGDAAAGDGREHVELIRRFGDGQGPLDLGAKRFGREGLFERFAIDRQGPGARPEKNAGCRCLPPAGAVILNCCCHDVMRPRSWNASSACWVSLVDGAGLRPLGGMRMLVVRIDFQLAPHRFAHLRLGQHAAHGFLHDPRRLLRAHVLRAFLADAAFVPGMIPIQFLFFLAAGEAHFGRVHDDDVIAGIDVRSEEHTSE